MAQTEVGNTDSVDDRKSKMRYIRTLDRTSQFFNERIKSIDSMLRTTRIPN